MQDEREMLDEEARDMDQVALVTTKNQLWRDLSWTMRKAYGGHAQDEPVMPHGYAQVATNPFGFETKQDLLDEIMVHIDALAEAETLARDNLDMRIMVSNDALEMEIAEGLTAYEPVIEEKRQALADALMAQAEAWQTACDDN
jgi:hypothetical protein